jgi:hypothetical protein
LIVIGGALLLGIGPFATSDSAGNDDPIHRVLTSSEKRATRLEAQVARHPQDPRMPLLAMQAWINAGYDRLGAIDTSSEPIPSAVPEDFRSGLREWHLYLRTIDAEADAGLAELAGGTYFQLVEIGSRDPAEATANAAGAVQALRIACRQGGNLFNLSNLAVYEYFNGKFAAGDRAAKKAAASVKKSVSKGVTEQLDEYKERGERFVRRVEQGMRTLEESEDEELEAPIKGYGAPAGINGYEPE